MIQGSPFLSNAYNVPCEVLNRGDPCVQERDRHIIIRGVKVLQHNIAL